MGGRTVVASHRLVVALLVPLVISPCVALDRCDACCVVLESLEETLRLEHADEDRQARGFPLYFLCELPRKCARSSSSVTFDAFVPRLIYVTPLYTRAPHTHRISSLVAASTVLASDGGNGSSKSRDSTVWPSSTTDNSMLSSLSAGRYETSEFRTSHLLEQMCRVAETYVRVALAGGRRVVATRERGINEAMIHRYRSSPCASSSLITVESSRRDMLLLNAVWWRREHVVSAKR